MEPVSNTWMRMRRSWHVVATVDELKAAGGLLQVWLLGEPWCLARVGGRLLAVPDRCPHRLAPLTSGCILEGALQCGYHGWRFDGDGRCRAIPALGAVSPLPGRADLVPAAGVQARFGLIWLAPEEPLADIHAFAEWDDDRFDRALTTMVRTPVSAAQLVDNFLDAAHFPFVHQGTFGVDEAAVVADAGIDRDGWCVETTYSTWYRNSDDPLVATGDHDAIQPQQLLKRGSASFSVFLRLGFPVTGSTIAILFCCTPERDNATRIYKLVARDDLAGDQTRMAAFIEDEDRILSEDLAILERYRRMEVSLDQRGEMHTRADRLSVAWRRLLGEMSRPLESVL